MRFVFKTVWIFLLTVVVLIGGLLAAPKLIGGQSYSVLSGSMSPTVDTGDMVAVVPVQGKDIQVGDIVAFNDPEGTGKLFQHRVISLESTGSNKAISVLTKGDANTATESWSVEENGQVGKVVFIVPKIGYLIGHITGGKPVTIAGKSVPFGMAIIIGLLFVFAIVILIQIFREKEDDLPEGGIYES